MKKTSTKIPGVYILEPNVYHDYRGWFMESWSSRELNNLNIEVNFVQENHSYTSKKGTIRGIHFQNDPMSQTKLVRVIKGSVLDVVVDLRKDSPTFMHWIAVELSENNYRQLFIPKGLGHGFLTLSDDVEFFYKCDNFYSKEHDAGIRYDDPNININWGIADPIISDKDKNLPFFAQINK